MTDLHADDLERKLLSLQENPSTALNAWIEALEAYLAANPPPEKAEEWFTTIQDALAKAQDADGSVAFLQWRIARATPAQNAAYWQKAANTVASAAPGFSVLIQEAGFGQRIAPRECVRRFLLLQSMDKGTMCLHRTWGFGVVRRVDSATRRIEVDFRTKAGHALAMQAAAEALELLQPEHLLARFFTEEEAIRAMVENEPWEVVKIALASFGPMPLAELKERLTRAGIVGAEEWKSFWDAVRKKLKTDPIVELPVKRTDPLRLMDAEAGYDDSWFNSLATERDLKEILARTREIAAAGDAIRDAADEGQVAILANRVAFLLLGASSKQPGLRLISAMLAAQLRLPAAQCNWPAVAEELIQGKIIVAALHDIPAKDLPPALAFLFAQNEAQTKTVLLNHLRDFHASVLGEIIKVLLQKNAEEDLRQMFTRATEMKSMPVEWLLWLTRNTAMLKKWQLPDAAGLSGMIVDELERDYMGERLKAQKQLRARFEGAEWLKATFGGFVPARRLEFFRRLNRSTAWSGLDRQVLQANVLKLYPELQSALTEDGANTSTIADAPARVTSHRSYREKQAQLDKLVNVDIPENSREIAVARSYGDLSENFEYKAAKDMQAVLHARRADLEKQLATVRPTDFADARTDVAAPGTRVTLAYPDGHQETFTLLGEWDQVPEKKIIASTTRLAQALIGRAAGEEAAIPNEAGEDTPIRVLSITPLDDATRQWIQ